ncbi:Uncharacterised protein [Mycobacteroides abscessus subsp. abscessus]|nr:Uncharacterised protein [Mycobacteroides abscessus subsp. abscessus]
MPRTAAYTPYAVARRGGGTRSATTARSVDSWMPTAAPQSSAPRTIPGRESVNANIGTVAPTIGRAARDFGPTRS